MKPLTTILLVGLGTALAAAPALAVTKYVHSGGSIQAAVDAAANGDTIVCGPGTFTENVVVSGRSNIRLVADSATIEAADSSRAAVAVVDSSECFVGSFTVHGGAGGCVRATRCSATRVYHNHCSAPGGPCVRVESCSAPRVDYNDCEDAGSDAICVSECPGAVVHENVVRRCGGHGVNVTAQSTVQGIVVTSNHLTNCSKNGIRCAGGVAARCASNAVDTCGYDGISCSGNSHVCNENRVRTCGHDGVAIVGDSCRCTYNSIYSVSHVGISLVGSGNTCSYNTITAALTAAVSVSGSANVLLGNLETACGQLLLNLGVGLNTNTLLGGGVRLRLL